MFFLPLVKGWYAVGATTFVTPVRPARLYGSAKRSRNNALSSDQLEPVLCMEEVAFTAYYPADTSSATQKGLDWLLRPASVSLKGFSAFAGVSSWLLWPIIYLFGIFVKIPVYTNAPLLRPAFGRSNSETTPPPQWPVVIFSHGLGGSRTAYSHFCSRLAASGKVVLAIEHRDGTGHACETRSWLDKGQKISRPIYYLKENQAVWDNQPNTEQAPYPLRVEQLEFRHDEIYIVYRTFSDFLGRAERSVELTTIDGSEIHDSWTMMDDETGFSPVKHCEDVTLAGHSFGGCTVLSILSTKPPSEHEPIPTTKALLLDPWLEPLPTPGPQPYLKAGSDKSIATSIISDVVKSWQPGSGNIITLVRSKHQSFSDFPILPFVRTKEAMTHLDVATSASLAFLDSSLEHYIEGASKRVMEALVVGVKANGKPKRKLVGSVGEIIVH
ncbi:hypothetical protein M378DRAFT_183750 [Amanita muscaria Koide BX008]|uniref:1-alkyl-2-acetylglycerophosphocholine esterase n=1 Tax=Amanita muscaria (strain Koide BX008) TaxID=946122 RepID=A0A0C2XKY5_AMAMK|nr:hypothetical protein M378DRAFT_183750 [Amanita muscaria Koide BX008]